MVRRLQSIQYDGRSPIVVNCCIVDWLNCRLSLLYSIYSWLIRGGREEEGLGWSSNTFLLSVWSLRVRFRMTSALSASVLWHKHNFSQDTAPSLNRLGKHWQEVRLVWTKTEVPDVSYESKKEDQTSLIKTRRIVTPIWISQLYTLA